MLVNAGFDVKNNMKKIREAKSINLESETQEEFGDAEGIIEIL